LAIGIVATPAGVAQDHDIVWVWSQRCRTPAKVALGVRLDGKVLYRTSLPLCQWERQFEEGKTSFRFTPPRPLVWYGYRTGEGDGTKDPGDTTPAGATLRVDFWQAGGESDFIELGFSVVAHDGIHMNSIHFVSPTESRLSTMAPGLVLETWPEKK
jgi:hypothetical protein